MILFENAALILSNYHIVILYDRKIHHNLDIVKDINKCILLFGSTINSMLHKIETVHIFLDLPMHVLLSEDSIYPAIHLQR